MNTEPIHTRFNRYDWEFLVCYKQPKHCSHFIGRIFGHVFLWRQVTKDSCVKIEPTMFGLLVIPYGCSLLELVDNIKKEAYTCVYETLEEDFQKVNIEFGFFHCTSIVKMCLGIRAWWIVLPWQLFMYCKTGGNHGR